MGTVKKKWLHDIKKVNDDGTVVLGEQVAPMTFMECVIDADGNTFENVVGNVEAKVALQLVDVVKDVPAEFGGKNKNYVRTGDGQWKLASGSGTATDASDINYTPDGTNIPSTVVNVQDAIDYIAENGGGGSADVEVDGTTISKTADGKLQVKDGGVTAAKLANDAKIGSIDISGSGASVMFAIKDAAGTEMAASPMPIAANTVAGVVVVDDAMSSTSTNPVQNKVVNAAIASLYSAVTDTTEYPDFTI